MSRQSLLILAIVALIALMFYCVRTHAPMLTASSTLANPNAALLELTSASLDANIASGKVTLDGVLPNEAARKIIIADAKKIFGETNVIDRTSINDKAAAAGWLPTLPKLFASLKPLAGGNLGIKDNEVTIKADVPTQNDKTALLQQVTASAGSNVKINDQISFPAPTASSLQTKLNELLLNRVIEFQTGDDTLTEKGKALLDETLPIIRASSQGEIEIAGHTDLRGAAEANQQLSQARAESVRDYLVAKGVSASRLKPIGYGASRPIADNNSAQGQKKNRRIEFSVKQ